MPTAYPAYPVPDNEHERLLALGLHAILDTPPEAEFDRITRLAKDVLSVKAAFISLLGHDRQFFKSRCGIDIEGTAREVAFCNYTIVQPDMMVVEDALDDPRFAGNPLVTGDPFIRFYAGTTLATDEGLALGTLCVIDSEPRTLDARQRALLAELGAIASDLLAKRRARLAAAHAGFYEDPRRVLDGIADTFFALDPDYRFLFVNKNAEKLFREPRETLEGQVMWRLFPELIQSDLHDKLVRAFTEQRDIEFEHFFDAWHVWYHVRIFAQKEGLSVYLSEITNQVKKSQALRDSELLKSAILDAAFDCIITIDDDARIIEFNPAAERTFGFTREEVLGRVMTDLIVPHQFRDAHTRGMERYMRTGEGPVLGRRIEISAIRHDNTEFPVELAISPIDLDNNRRLFTAYLRDITQRKEAERTLRDALDKERKLVEMKSRFVAQASHEFRTPLSMIRSSAQLIRRVFDLDPDKIFKYLERIDDGIADMIQLLDDLLMLSESQATDWPFNPHPLRFDLLLQNTIHEVSLAIGKPTNFTTRGNVDDLQIVLDKKLIRLVLNNLLTNALKYSQAADSPIEVLSHLENDVLTISIADQGIGIPEDELGNLFEPFHRAENVGTRPGTGLGLSIVKAAVERQGGTIAVASMVGEGTTFTFSLPTAVETEPVADLS